MRIKIKLLAVLLIFNFNLANADEGMWVVSLIGKNYEQMQKLGLKLSADDIYNINQSSLKDAIIQFGRGCTGEIVSDKGLIFTNHHCGFGAIQKHSTIDHNYLKNGFWAKTYNDELANAGLTAKFLIRIEDVSSEILNGLDKSLTEEQRGIKIRELSKQIIAQRVKTKGYSGDVKAFFQGNQFLLFVYEIYSDVRLVGAPPSSIGKFGGDTDNWMWPRHTADFSVFRVYMSPDGKPAEYSKDNVPLKPKHHLPISIKGVKENDFAMILGYPGRTNRYKSSFGIKQDLEINNPAIIKIRTKKLAILKEDMQKSDAIKIKYASKYARTSNYWKYFIGQNKGLRRLHVIDKKQELEKEFNIWVNKDSERKKIYGGLVKNIETSYNKLEYFNLLKVYYREAAIRGSDGIGLSNRFIKLYKILDNDEINKDKLNSEIEKLKKVVSEHFRNLNLETELKLTASLLQMYYDDIDIAYHPTIFDKVRKKYKGDLNKFTADIYKKSIFRDKESLDKFLENPTSKVLGNDQLYVTMNSIYGSYNKFRTINKLAIKNLEKQKRLYVKGITEMKKGNLLYPDANMSMRLTYGKIMDYIPRDAVRYDYFTTLSGVMQKEDPNSDEFIVPAKLKELYTKKDFGRYAENGKLHTCFVSNNDITGGNSGSPVINANGELIGIAFDGNWEAMSGDIAFEHELQRTISVDARYVLFIIDKFANSNHIINELDIVSNIKQVKAKPLHKKEDHGATIGIVPKVSND